ncbi:TniB family NTP-binding protein [Chitinibacter tainanensis]|uniref:TniB family NTP-binding protein n=1 Tax=Chitinibacter tainanensis TaxID=230667 RepID=UPI00040DD86B|nr:TniB family NTP-binding protein [Chitinibacter tainanensis]
MIDDNFKSEDLIDRIAKLDNVVVQHPDMINAIEGIKRCINLSEKYREPVGCMLLAEGGMGKSTICKLIEAGLPKGIHKTETEEIKIISAFRAEVPSQISLSHLASNILSGLSDSTPDSGTIAGKTKRIATHIKNCQTKVIFLDECHNFLVASPVRNSAHIAALRWIKSLVNSTSACLCLVGTEESESIIDSDMSFQLTRRFKYRFRIRKLMPGTSKNPGELYYFLDRMGTHLKKEFLLENVHLADSYLNTVRIYLATSGNLDYIMTLIKEGLQLTLGAAGKQLTLDDFAIVWDSGIMHSASCTKRNPFRLSEADLAGEFRRYK